MGHATSTTQPTTYPRPTGTADPFELSTKMLLMPGGTGLVAALGVIAERRK